MSNDGKLRDHLSMELDVNRHLLQHFLTKITVVWWASKEYEKCSCHNLGDLSFTDTQFVKIEGFVKLKHLVHKQTPQAIDSILTPRFSQG